MLTIRTARSWAGMLYRLVKLPPSLQLPGSAIALFPRGHSSMPSGNAAPDCNRIRKASGGGRGKSDGGGTHLGVRGPWICAVD